jgi:hypothetical protein
VAGNVRRAVQADTVARAGQVDHAGLCASANRRIESGPCSLAGGRANGCPSHRVAHQAAFFYEGREVGLGRVGVLERRGLVVVQVPG